MDTPEIAKLGITPEEAAMGISINRRRGRLTTTGIDSQLMKASQNMETELAKLARQFKRVEKLRKRIQRLRAQRMTATNPEETK
jgi:diaminopimelate decarboxylase